MAGSLKLNWNALVSGGRQRAGDTQVRETTAGDSGIRFAQLIIRNHETNGRYDTP